MLYDAEFVENRLPFRPIRNTFAPMPADPQTRDRIEAIVRDYPDWGADRVDTVLKCDGYDVPFAMVQTVLAELRQR